MFREEATSALARFHAGLVELEFEVLVFVEGAKPENPEKNPWGKRKPINPHMLPDWNRTQATPVGGERSVKSSQLLVFKPPVSSPSQLATLLGYSTGSLKKMENSATCSYNQAMRFTTLFQPILTLVLFDAHSAPIVRESAFIP